jgi:hypothetical protein
VLRVSSDVSRVFDKDLLRVSEAHAVHSDVLLHA